MNRGLGRLGIGALIAWASVAGPASAAADGTVWASGRFGERPIEAVLQPAGTRLVGRAAACAGCHGAEAEGGGEGVRAPALVHRGRLRRGLDSASLARALEAGIGLDGRPLHPAMPRYLLQPGMAAVLVQELEEIGRRSVEGVETDRIVLATVWPDRTGIAPVRAVVARFRTLLEREGGIFGRRLELVELPVEPRQAAARLAARPALALLLDDAPEALLAPLRGRGWPELFPLRPADGDEPATVRRLGPARPVEARALLDAAIADLGGRGRIRLLAPPALAAELAPQLARHPELVAVADGPVDALVLLRRPTEPLAARRLYAPVDLLARVPTSYLAGAEAVVASDPRALPPGSAAPSARAHQLLGEDEPTPAARHAAAALLILEVALRRLGRDVTRARLLASLDALGEVTTGLVPPWSGRPSADRRPGLVRLGAGGPVRVEPSLVPSPDSPVRGSAR